jgi:hypothetical protein
VFLDISKITNRLVRLDQVLGLDISGIQALGIAPLGLCMRLRNAVLALAAQLLRACEAAAPPNVRAPSLAMNKGPTSLAAVTPSASQ